VKADGRISGQQQLVFLVNLDAHGFDKLQAQPQLQKSATLL